MTTNPSQPQNDSSGQSAQIPPIQTAPAASQVQWWAMQPQKPSVAWRVVKIFCWLIFFCSLLTNFFLMAMLMPSVERGQLKKSVLKAGKEDQIVALYEVKGVIDDAQAAKLAKFCDEIAGDSNVKAVLLRVDSPGGGVSSADQMCRRIKHLKEKGKKIVVSMGSVAASGGYYISAPADEIFAEPTTLTGSIGVIGTWIVIKDGLEKIGIQPVVMKSSSAQLWKDEISPFSQPNNIQREHLQALLDAYQSRFDDVVKEGRGDRLKMKNVEYDIKTSTAPDAKIVRISQVEPLNAKVYLGADALAPGLVDKIGYQDDAINSAKTLAGLSDAMVVKYEPQTSLLDIVLQGKANQSMQLSTKLLDEFQSVRIMAIWHGQ